MTKFKVFNFPDKEYEQVGWALSSFTKKVSAFLEEYQILDVQLQHNTTRTKAYVSYLIRYIEKE